MEPTKPKIPAEAVELYNLYIHGVISRRAFMDNIKKFAIGGLATAALMEALMPNYAAAQQVAKTTTASRRATKPCNRRKATEASRDTWCGRSAPIRATKCPRSYPALSWCTKIVV